MFKNKVRVEKVEKEIGPRNNIIFKNRKVGINCLANRLTVINNKIPLNWLNLSLDTYKVKCKKLFLN